MADGTRRPALAGQAALVTGGSSGIGAGVVEAFAAAGAMVAINYNSRREEADQAVERIEAAGGRAFAGGADVSDEAAGEGVGAPGAGGVRGCPLPGGHAGLQTGGPFPRIAPR